MCGVSSLFVYTMSQVQICACTRICIWRMYIIELLSEMVYKVYESSRSQPTRFGKIEGVQDGRYPESISICLRVRRLILLRFCKFVKSMIENP